VQSIHSEDQLGQALLALIPRLVPFLMSFMTLGIFWVGQQTQHDALERTDRSYTWLHIAFLMAVCLTPFSTSLLAEFIAFRIALLVYWANIFLLGVLLLSGWFRARWFGLVSSPCHFCTFPLSSFTSRKRRTWGLLNWKSVTVPLTVTIFDVSYDAVP